MSTNEPGRRAGTIGRGVAVVTGAASGIGRETARALRSAGFTVIGTSRRAAAADQVEGVELRDLDVTDDASVTALIDQVVTEFGRIDVLVNNAGIGLTAAAEESSVGQAGRIFDLNVLGVIRMTNAVLPHMRAAGHGRIITVSSVLGLIPAPYMAVYAATKHAVEGYSESLDHEVREFGIRALLVEPGYTRTSFEANNLAGDAPIEVYAARRAVAQQVLADAMHTADEPSIVAKVIVDVATAGSPPVRTAAGRTARSVSILRRLVPARAFDGQIRKLNRLPR
ncbi:oxidoreductase [Microbacterium sp. NPDC089189]|uniref:oxidoreductase n=1 Tax=Microbacterium sp. NPDC089189 TaxID=3154972 RepID=UPI0034150B36